MIGLCFVDAFDEKGFAVKDERVSVVMGREFGGEPKAAMGKRLHGESVGDMEFFQILIGERTTGVIDGESGAEGDI